MCSKLSEANSQKYEKPLPEVNPITKPFWEYCKSHELRMQFCTNCNEWIWYPKAWCPSCGSRSGLEWRKTSGKGTVYSFTLIRQVIDNSPAFQAEIPFVIGLIELEEGPRIYSNVENKEVEIGDLVSVYFEDVTPEFSLPKFRKNQP
jgi:uncharacterized OB-fold protein